MNIFLKSESINGYVNIFGKVRNILLKKNIFEIAKIALHCKLYPQSFLSTYLWSLNYDKFCVILQQQKKRLQNI